MRVYTKVGNTIYVLGKDELWTVNDSVKADPAEYTEKEANQVVAEFKGLDEKHAKEYWAE